MELAIAKEIVEKLNSGKYGLLSLAREYNIPPKEIVNLPKVVKEKEEEKGIKEKFKIAQEKEVILGEIEHKIFLLKKALIDDLTSDFSKYARCYIRVLKRVAREIKKCKDERELALLINLAHTYFSGIEIEDDEVISLKNPAIKLYEWLE